ncbi:transmembrane emp24 domain-containing protein 10-like [Ciona intestinalis]|uniref:transmembrane emp24 domain-containing protein 10-like n=1 Tax=Ciona intestinalis TaxID=7719 RepID=UPI000180BAA8|nr:transmembrane emp24 domain-containing protein 10-like [Ciona intestinalis]|eukprot:XP_002128822.1 transmembrane emp24 domain-containing protein 10-like [Ciona intestinalis]
MNLYILFGTLLLIKGAYSIYFELPMDTEKCLREEIHKDVLVTGDYDVSTQPSVKVSLKVTDTNGHILYQKDEATQGKFAFTTDDYDMFQICFTSKADFKGKMPPQEVKLLLKRGVEAKNYDELAKTEKLKPLEVELRRLEDLSESIVQAFAYMKKREEEMRNTNESTNSRVLYFSMFSMLCLIGLATWQVLYLRKFFKSKKLIE